MAWFHANEKFPDALHISYVEFSKYVLGNIGSKIWTQREKYRKRRSRGANYDFCKALEKVAERMYHISPRERERYFLRTLLLNKAGPTSFSGVRTHEGV